MKTTVVFPLENLPYKANHLLIDDNTVTMIVTIRCLTLLLMSTKVKNSTGDVPYAIKFVSVSYTAS